VKAVECGIGNGIGFIITPFVSGQSLLLSNFIQI